jgi:phosphonate transport system substrate-binding protein
MGLIKHSGRVFRHDSGREGLIPSGIKILIVLLIILICSCSPRANEEKKVYRIGYMICNSEEETLHRFAPLTAYLSEKLGVGFEGIAIDTVDFTREVENLDFTHTNSLLYIMMNRNHGVEILAAETAGPLGARSRGAIVVLKDSPVRDLKDLKGRTMVFGPMLGPTSYMTQLDLLLKGGVDPEDDLAFYSIPSGSYKHEKNIYGVLFEKYDAGAFPMLDFERMISEGKIEREDFRVIAEGDPIPYCNFGVSQRIDDSFAKRFRRALLDLKRETTVEINGERVRVLDRAQVEGYEEIRDSDFDGLREMAKRTNMPPYQKY